MATIRPAATDPRPEKRDFRQEVTDSIIQMLEQGVAPWQKPWDASALQTPYNPTSSKPYRGGNALHFLAVGLKKGYSDPRWTTYKQASENGWQVRKSEKGTQIEFWDFSRTDPAGASRSNEPAANGVGDATGAGAKTDARRPLHRVYTVFNAQQIDGIPEYKPKAHTAFEVAEAGETILRNSGAIIHYDQRDRAFYNRVSDAIHLPRKEGFKDAAGFYGTVLHELSHWVGHESRLNRSSLTGSYRFGDLNYAKEELRAEIASVFIAAERGIPHDPNNHAAYVGSWIKALQDDKHEIFRASQDASKAADYLLALERDQSVAQAVEIAAPDRVLPPDPTLSPQEQASRSTEGLPETEGQIRREIAAFSMDRDLAGDREGAASSPMAPELEAVRQSSPQTARFNRGNGTLNVHDKQSASGHHVPVSAAIHANSQQQTGNGTERRPPTRDQLANSFDAARKVVADAMGDAVRTTAALTASGTYRGSIIAETDHHVLQQVSAQTAVAHMKHALTPVPEVGENVVIAYSNSKAAATESRQRSRTQELSR